MNAAGESNHDGAPEGRVFPQPVKWPDLFGPHDPFTLTDGVGQGATNRRADVAKVETLLGAAGYHDLDRTEGPTGYFGETLNQSIRRFQKDRELEIDGYLRPKGETIISLKGLLGSSTAEKRDGGSLSILDCDPQKPPKKPVPPPDPWLEAIKDIREAFDGLIGWFDWGLGHDDAETRRRFTAFLDQVAARTTNWRNRFAKDWPSARAAGASRGGGWAIPSSTAPSSRTNPISARWATAP
ncbi:MAG: peptidoglycan-binding protein [Rhodospirillales bacterium]|nr:peptidoglycan-binding protein [Rhodospirillales bacterium]